MRPKSCHRYVDKDYICAFLSPAQLHDVVILHPRLDARRKAACALILGEADKALCDGADEELWTLETGLRIWKALAV